MEVVLKRRNSPTLLKKGGAEATLLVLAPFTALKEKEHDSYY